jgi:rhamnosyltransferase
MNKSRYSLIIRCYNEEKHIKCLLDKITSQTVKDLEIIVVDSGSTDNTLNLVKKYSVQILHISPKEFTFGRSLNIGCRAANGEFIVITSPHCYPVGNNWVEKLLLPFADPKVALVYGKQRGSETSKFSEQRIFEVWFPGKSDMDQSHPFCNNANTVIRRSVWEKMPYNESLTGLEDLEWAKKVIALGYKIAYVAEAEIVHIHDESPKRIYNRYKREAIAFRHIFPDERFSFFTFIHLFTANVVCDFFYALRGKVLSRNFKSIITFRFMQFWGTYKGFKQKKPVTDKLREIFYYPRKK